MKESNSSRLCSTGKLRLSTDPESFSFLGTLREHLAVAGAQQIGNAANDHPEITVSSGTAARA